MKRSPDHAVVLSNAWHRSQRSGLDQRTDPNDVARTPVNTETCLYRAAEAVLGAVEDDLDGERFGLLVTDRKGVLLKAITRDHRFRDAMRSAGAEPGASYSEGTLGANAIGTAIEAGTDVRLQGAEHYNEHMREFSCLAMPLVEPRTLRLLGVVNMATHVAHDRTLSRPYLRSIARELCRGYLVEVQAERNHLYERYLAACAKYGAVVAVSSESIFASREAIGLLHRDDIRRIQELVETRMAASGEQAELPDGVEVIDEPYVVSKSGIVVAFSRRQPTRSVSWGDTAASLGTARKWPRIDALERDAVVQALRANAGNKLAAANWLGVSRRTIYNKISCFRITASEIDGVSDES